MFRQPSGWLLSHSVHLSGSNVINTSHSAPAVWEAQTSAVASATVSQQQSEHNFFFLDLLFSLSSINYHQRHPFPEPPAASLPRDNGARRCLIAPELQEFLPLCTWHARGKVRLMEEFILANPSSERTHFDAFHCDGPRLKLPGSAVASVCERFAARRKLRTSGWNPLTLMKSWKSRPARSRL